MQFELSTRQLDAAEIATALRPLDPDARVAFDAEHGHLEVLSSASAEQVLGVRSEEHTSELQSLMRISYAVFCLKKKQITNTTTDAHRSHIEYPQHINTYVNSHSHTT